MSRLWVIGMVVLALLAVRSGYGDGVMVSFVPVGKSADLVSSPKQEAVLIAGDEWVTVILRTHFARGPEEVAWLVPVPNEPKHIRQRDDDIFAQLDEATAPTFFTEEFRGHFGFGCAAAGPSREMLPAVRHEASGIAGMFQYDVLTAHSAKSLTAWLTERHYAVPAGIETSLDSYVARKWHFLALRLRPGDAATATLAPQAITYSYGVDKLPNDEIAEGLVYPLIISKVSAATQNEVVLYVLGAKQYACSNWDNVNARHMVISADPNSASGTDYENQLRDIAKTTTHAFFIEYATDMSNDGWQSLRNALLKDHDEITASVKRLYLMRMRALIPPDAMDRDVVLVPLESPMFGEIFKQHLVHGVVPASSGGGSALGLLGIFGMAGCVIVRRKIADRRSRLGRALFLASLGVGMIALVMM